MPEKGDDRACCGGQPVMITQPSSCCDRASTDLKGLPIYKTPGPASSDRAFNARSSRAYWVDGSIDTPCGQVPRVKASLTFRDTLGAWRARWGINRMRYTISPGLYAVGSPDEMSPVLVSANYKMSFDRLRRELAGLDAWIMVLDTKGINVWCAAGKGTFGTAEIVRRIAAVGLDQVVAHRTVIVPQLGAPGVAAHEVRKQSGFKVVYGPARASDIRAFLQANMKATPDMRDVHFGFLDRLVLTPIELVGILKPLVIIAVVLLTAHLAGLLTVSLSNLLPFIGAVLIGAVIAPTLLPWIPGRAFSLKGWFMGMVWIMAVLYFDGSFSDGTHISRAISLLLLVPAISAFLTMNFTGASTYTSLSGVKKEMRIAVPAIITSASAGILFGVVALIWRI